MFTTDKNANIKNEFKYIANYVSKIWNLNMLKKLQASTWRDHTFWEKKQDFRQNRS